MELISPIEHASVFVDDMRVNYDRAGRGPALVLVHGLVGSARNWQQNIAYLSRFRTVYALDLANMGNSERVAGLDPGIEASADRVVRWMDALGIETADIAGHSHGGAITMMLAARHPERVDRLVLFAPANPFCQLGRGLIRFYNSSFGSYFAHLIPFMPRSLMHVAHRRMYVDSSAATPGQLAGYTDGLNRESIDHILGIVSRWWHDMALLRERLVEVADCRVLLIWGDRDTAVGLSSGRRLAEVLGAHLLVVPGVGHLPFAERPEFCNDAVREWLHT